MNRAATLAVAFAISLGGCVPSTGLLRPGPLLGATSADEVAYGVTVSGATVANYTYASLVNNKLVDKATALALKSKLDALDGLISAARAARTLGDANGYLAKLRAADDLLKAFNAALPKR